MNVLPNAPLRPRPILCLVLLLLIATASGCGEQEASGQTKDDKGPTVKVAKIIERDDVITSRYYVGDVEASERVEIRARVLGVLEEVLFEDGTDVEEGQLLFVIEKQQYEARLAGATALLAGAENTLKEAEDRVRRGCAAGTAISEEDLATRITQRDVAKASVDEAAASVRDAKINLGYTEIRSPIKGQIGRRLIDRGNLVGVDGNTLLTTVVNRQPIEVYFEVSGPVIDRFQRMKNEMRKKMIEQGKSTEDRDLESWNVVAEGKLKGETGYPHKGKLDYVDFEIDRMTGTAKVRAVFENKDDLIYSGADFNVRLPSPDSQTAMLIHEEAIGTNTQGRFIYVVVPEAEIDGKVMKNVVETRQIEVGGMFQGMRIVAGRKLEHDGPQEKREKLEPGEAYIVEGLQRVRPGISVEMLPFDKVESSDVSAPPQASVNPPPPQS